MNPWTIAAAAVTCLVGIVTIVGILIAVGKGWAGFSSAVGKVDALHRRLDSFQTEQEKIKIAVTEVRTVLRLHPTLRFRLESPPPQGGQDIFPPGEEG